MTVGWIGSHVSISVTGTLACIMSPKICTSSSPPIPRQAAPRTWSSSPTSSFTSPVVSPSSTARVTPDIDVVDTRYDVPVRFSCSSEAPTRPSGGSVKSA